MDSSEILGITRNEHFILWNNEKLGKIHQVGKTPLWWIHLGVSTPELFVTRKFFCKPVLVLVQSTPRNRLTVVFITGNLRFLNVFTTGELRFPSVYTTGELRLPGVFITAESFWTLGSRLPILRSIDNLWSPLPGVFLTGESGLSGIFMIGESFRMPGVVFIDFKEHTTSKNCL
jgi:hypothetical protein